MVEKQQLHYVIQKHAATRLHYDFRLEIRGILKSWAIPKGPSLDPTLKRLAMQTPDHDFAYRNFEGTIAKDSVGAGTVMIWDEGIYLPEIEIAKGVRKTISDKKEGMKIMEEGLEKGELKFYLHGKKLQGSFALIKTKNFGPKNAWLLLKHSDRFVSANYDANAFDFSAVTNKSLQEIAESI